MNWYGAYGKWYAVLLTPNTMVISSTRKPFTPKIVSLLPMKPIWRSRLECDGVAVAVVVFLRSVHTVVESGLEAQLKKKNIGLGFFFQLLFFFFWISRFLVSIFELFMEFFWEFLLVSENQKKMFTVTFSCFYWILFLVLFGFHFFFNFVLFSFFSFWAFLFEFFKKILNDIW